MYFFDPILNCCRLFVCYKTKKEKKSFARGLKIEIYRYWRLCLFALIHFQAEAEYFCFNIFFSILILPSALVPVHAVVQLALISFTQFHILLGAVSGLLTQ